MAPLRIPVRDNTAGTVSYMWEIDAEEAVRNDATGVRFTPVVPDNRKPPKKNPGGRGF